MAVVFISPKKRQQTFLVAIAAGFVVLMVVFSLFVFLAQPSENIPALVFNKPKVAINMDVFSSDQFKNLAPFSEIQMQFSYTGLSKDAQKVAGLISAASQDDAVSILKATGITISSIQQAEIGRDNPFIPYYQVAPPPSQTKK